MNTGMLRYNGYHLMAVLFHVLSPNNINWLVVSNFFFFSDWLSWFRFSNAIVLNATGCLSDWLSPSHWLRHSLDGCLSGLQLAASCLSFRLSLASDFSAFLAGFSRHLFEALAFSLRSATALRAALRWCLPGAFRFAFAALRRGRFHSLSGVTEPKGVGCFLGENAGSHSPSNRQNHESAGARGHVLRPHQVVQDRLDRGTISISERHHSFLHHIDADRLLGLSAHFFHSSSRLLSFGCHCSSGSETFCSEIKDAGPYVTKGKQIMRFINEPIKLLSTVTSLIILLRV